ncbi:hypothetical protein ACE41H_15595 [Paenibacillus enshidis]|uniref:Uncharacterized protein n=1 Tax=Paenibacillus enshidis TaxID=1458439 RepID=A0ABV5AVE5_9BACL
MSRYLWKTQINDGAVIDISGLAARMGFISTIAMTKECMLQLTGVDFYVPESRRRIEECLFTLYAVSSICPAGRLRPFSMYIEDSRLMELTVYAGFGDYMEPIMVIDISKIIAVKL